MNTVTVSSTEFSEKFEMEWIPLMAGTKKVFLWDRTAKCESGPVIYRHVLESNGIVHTIYVGQGKTLKSKGASLVGQYSHGGHGKSRKKVRSYFAALPDQLTGWTEVLKCNQVNIDSDAERLALESLLVGFYFFKSLRCHDFASRGLFYLNGGSGGK